MNKVLESAGNGYQLPKPCSIYKNSFDLCFADQTLFEKSDHSRKNHIVSFTQWFNENGGKAEHVLIDDFGQQGLGLKASSDIKVMYSPHITCTDLMYYFWRHGLNIYVQHLSVQMTATGKKMAEKKLERG